MQTMYPGMTNSPMEVINNPINAAATTIEVSNAASFPAAPNYATIGTDGLCETILYAAKTDAALSGCTRGVEGVAQDWGAGTPIARNFTNADYAALVENIKELERELATKSPSESPVLTGDVIVPTLAPNVKSNAAASTQYVHNAVSTVKLEGLDLPTDKVDCIAATDDILSAFEKLQFQNGVKLMSASVGSSTAWVKVATMKSGVTAPLWGLFHARFTGGGAAYTAHYFMDVKLSVGVTGGAQALRIMSVTALTNKNTDNTYFLPELGYVLDGDTFDIYVKVSKSTSGMMMHPVLLDDMVIPHTFDIYTTEPAGIVYVDAVTYATSDAFNALSNAYAAHAADTDNPHVVTAEQVELGNVDNTSDADKPISTAAAAALATKAPLNLSAGFAPAAALSNLAAGDSVETALSKLQASDVIIPTTSVNDTETWTLIHEYTVTNTDWWAVSFMIAGGCSRYDGKNETYYTGGFSGNGVPRFSALSAYLVTPASWNNWTCKVGYTYADNVFRVYLRSVRTDAQKAYMRDMQGNMIKSNFTLTTTEPAGIVYVEPTTYATTASPAFTGTPTVPTAAPGTNTTQAASTAFVQAAVEAAGGSSSGGSSSFSAGFEIVKASSDTKYHYKIMEVSSAVSQSTALHIEVLPLGVKNMMNPATMVATQKYSFYAGAVFVKSGTSNVILQNVSCIDFGDFSVYKSGNAIYAALNQYNDGVYVKITAAAPLPNSVVIYTTPTAVPDASATWTQDTGLGIDLRNAQNGDAFLSDIPLAQCVRLDLEGSTYTVDSTHKNGTVFYNNSNTNVAVTINGSGWSGGESFYFLQLAGGTISVQRPKINFQTTELPAVISTSNTKTELYAMCCTSSNGSYSTWHANAH